MRSRRIAYVGRFPFPSGAAASMRVLSLSKALRDGGCEVVVVGHAGRDARQLSGSCEGIEWHCLPDEGHHGHWRDLLTYGLRTRSKLDELGWGFDALIVYGDHASLLLPLLRAARRRAIAAIADVVEWHDYRHMALGRLNPIAWEIHLGLTRVIPACDGVIAISTFLEQYYRRKGNSVLRVPQLVDLTEEKWSTGGCRSYDPEALNLAFAGVPGKKERLGTVMAAMCGLIEEGARIKLHLFGPSEADLRGCPDYVPGTLEALAGRHLFLYGVIDPQAVPAAVARADFTVLLRPRERFAQAGFPTKLVESLAAGVPVIANLTSDLAEYLHDGREALVCEDSSVNAARQALVRALSLSPGQRNGMRRAARRRAEASFDYRHWIEPLRSFRASLGV